MQSTSIVERITEHIGHGNLKKRQNKGTLGNWSSHHSIQCKITICSVFIQMHYLNHGHNWVNNHYKVKFYLNVSDKDDSQSVTIQRTH